MPRRNMSSFDALLCGSWQVEHSRPVLPATGPALMSPDPLSLNSRMLACVRMVGSFCHSFVTSPPPFVLPLYVLAVWLSGYGMATGWLPFMLPLPPTTCDRSPSEPS